MAPTHCNRGIGRRLLAELLARARRLGCGETWLGTSYDNTAARRMYAAAGGVEDKEPTLIITFPLGDKESGDEGREVQCP